VMFSSLPAAMASIKVGRIKAIAVSGKTRAGALPDIPTVIESGVAGYDVEYWYGIFAPAATPRDVLARLGDEIGATLKLADTIANLANQGAVPGSLTQAQFADFVKSEVAKWGGVVRSSGARAD
jgi:tripartite-type tricarboxylate transporter receptor subunit TctC